MKNFGDGRVLKLYRSFTRPLPWWWGIRSLALNWAAVAATLIWNFGPFMGGKILTHKAVWPMWVVGAFGLLIWRIAATLIARWHARIIVSQRWGIIAMPAALAANCAAIVICFSLMEPLMMAGRNMTAMSFSMSIKIAYGVAWNWIPSNLMSFGDGNTTISIPNGSSLKPLHFFTRPSLVLIAFYVLLYARALRRIVRLKTTEKI